MSANRTDDMHPTERIITLAQGLLPSAGDRAALLRAIADLLDYHAECQRPDVLLRESSPERQPRQDRPGSPVNVIVDDAARFREAARQAEAAASPAPKSNTPAPDAQA